MGAQAPNQQQPNQQQQQKPQMGPPPPAPAPKTSKFKDYYQANKGSIGDALMAMGTSMMSQETSTMPTSFMQAVGQGATKGITRYGESQEEDRLETERERVRKQQEILQQRAGTTFANQQQTHANTQADRATQETKRLEMEEMAKDMDLSGMPDSMRQVLEFSIKNGDYGAATQAISQYKTQQLKNAGTAKAAGGGLFSGDPQMDNAGMIATSDFVAKNGRQPSTPADMQEIQKAQIPAYNTLQSQKPRPDPGETEASKLQAKRNDTVRTDFATKRGTFDKLRNHNQIALNAVNRGLNTGPFSDVAHNAYAGFEQFALALGMDEQVEKIGAKAEEMGIDLASKALFDQSMDRAAIDVTGDMSGQISNFELQLAAGTNVSPEDRPDSIRKIVAYKELQYAHQDAREAAMYEAWDKADAKNETFNADKHLRQWDRDNRLTVEDDTTPSGLTPYGEQLLEIGLIRPMVSAESPVDAATATVEDEYIVQNGVTYKKNANGTYDAVP